MTDEQKIATVKTLVGNDSEATNELLAVYLNMAESAIMQRCYPRGVPEGQSMPSEYEYLQCNLAARYFFRRGAEGEVTHNEDGVNRTYGSVNDEDILREVMQRIRL